MMSNFYSEMYKELEEENEIITSTFEEYLHTRINDLRIFTFPLTKRDLKIILHES